MGDTNGRWGGSVTNCPECAAQVRADFISHDDELACHACGCRFTLPPFGLGPFAHWADEDRVIEHGDRWRRLVIRASHEVDWGDGFIGIGWDRLSQGAEFYVGLGPLSLHMFIGPGVR